MDLRDLQPLSPAMSSRGEILPFLKGQSPGSEGRRCLNTCKKANLFVRRLDRDYPFKLWIAVMHSGYPYSILSESACWYWVEGKHALTARGVKPAKAK